MSTPPSRRSRRPARRSCRSPPTSPTASATARSATRRATSSGCSRTPERSAVSGLEDPTRGRIRRSVGDDVGGAGDAGERGRHPLGEIGVPVGRRVVAPDVARVDDGRVVLRRDPLLGDRGDVPPSASGGEVRSEEHTSELQSLMRISYAVFCLKKKKTNKTKIR